ncbi:MAG: acyl dehydratase [Rhodobacteraceae bacterium]|nr:acyl dehydratase [Paracoccaceae bacterium]MBR29450.1 acyl dehydratase [Paracoccaceae bacterium]
MTYPETLGPLALVSSHATAMAYGELTADFNPIHCDPDFAAKSPFGRAICHGTMGLNLAIEVAERALAPAYAVRDVKIRFSRPAPVGETLTAGATLTDAATGTYALWVELPDGTRTTEGTLTAEPAP